MSLRAKEKPKMLRRRRPSRRVIIEALRIINQNRIAYLRFLNDTMVRAVVRGENDVYIVTYNLKEDKTSCTCPAGLKGIPCKHAEAVRIYVGTLLARKSQARIKSVD